MGVPEFVARLKTAAAEQTGVKVYQVHFLSSISSIAPRWCIGISTCANLYTRR